MEISRATGALLILVFIPVIRSVRWERNMGWCIKGDHLFLGDFNGDGKADLLCHQPRTGYKWIAFANVNGQFTGTNWERDIRWCNLNSEEIHIGDFNGDGRSDMLCHDASSGRKKVALANSNGDFTGGTSWQSPLAWCNQAASELHIGDFDGDGRDDMLCHNKNDGYVRIAYASGSGTFYGRGWEKGIGWCAYSGSQLFIGDFNGDSKSDLLCHDNTGRKRIAYASSAGNFGNDPTGWEGNIHWCYHSSQELYIGDYNGDGQDDLLCHETGTGQKWVALANNHSNFSGGTSWKGSFDQWCYHATGELHVGDFNGDHKTDMLCHDTGSGWKWIAYAELTIFS